MTDDESNKLLERVARMDERTLHMMVTLKQLSDLVASNYVTKQEFSPVRSIVYGMMGFVGVAVLSAVIGSIIIKAGGG